MNHSRAHHHHSHHFCFTKVGELWVCCGSKNRRLKNARGRNWKQLVSGPKKFTIFFLQLTQIILNNFCFKIDNKVQFQKYIEKKNSRFNWHLDSVYVPLLLHCAGSRFFFREKWFHEIFCKCIFIFEQATTYTRRRNRRCVPTPRSSHPVVR